MASCGPVVVWVTGMAINNDDFDQLRKIYDGPLAKAPQTGLIMVLREGTKMPEMGARKAAAKMIEEVGDRFCGMHVVLRGSGFWASALRSAITGLALLIRKQQSARAYSEVREAADELVKQIPSLDAAALTQAVERLIAQEAPARAASE
ncbi:hypothetical protein ACNOYE_20255 [Nannocystaceae bacterium ST9]